MKKKKTLTDIKYKERTYDVPQIWGSAQTRKMRAKKLSGTTTVGKPEFFKLA